MAWLRRILRRIYYPVTNALIIAGCMILVMAVWYLAFWF